MSLALLLAACVAFIPILKEDKKPPTYIGVAHTVFGIPSDMQVYPWVALKEEKDLTLAQGLEQRIADALQGTQPEQ